MQQVFHVLKFYLHINIVFLVAESFFAPEIKKKKISILILNTSDGCWNSEKCFEFSKIKNYVKAS